jgi:hypothetical protein
LEVSFLNHHIGLTGLSLLINALKASPAALGKMLARESL